jgi:hypothetical protein
MKTAYFIPALDLLPYWPHDLVAPSDVPLLGDLAQYIGVTDFDVVEYEGYLTAFGTLAVWEEVELKLPLVEGFSLVLGETGGGITEFPFELRLGQASDLTFGGSAVESALALFLKGYLPPYELCLPQLDVKLRVDRRYLKPMVPNVADDPEAGFHDAPEDPRVELVVRGVVAINTDTGITIEGFDRIDLDYAQIGSTGVVIRAEDLLLRFSDAQPMPDIDPEAVDLPSDWKGILFREISVYNLQAAWEHLPPSLELTNWYFGSGGVTGKAAAVFDLTPDMTGRTFALRTLQLVLEQNVLVQALVQMAVRLEFWDNRVFYLDAAITNDPELDFPESLGFLGAVSAEQPEGTQPGALEELLPLTLSAGSTPLFHLGITKLGIRSLPDPTRAADQGQPADTRFFDILVDGHAQVMPASGVGDAAFGAAVRELGLQVAPTFQLLLPGGLWIEVSEELLTRISAFPLSISRIGFGSEGDEKWIGLDARLSFGGGTSVGSAVKGLRIFFGGAAGVHLSFEGIEIKVARLPAFSVYGLLSMTSGADPSEVADSTDYTFQGGVELFIGGSIGLTIDGHLLFGTKAGTRFWYVALDGTLNPGITIFSGVALLGGALMLGNNVAPNRQLSGDQGDAFNWYEHWYKPAPGAYSVIHSAKWQAAEDYWALGAGVSVGNPSDGKMWSLKALLTLLFPGPIVILEGRLRLLKTPEEHTGPPSSELIRGLIVLDFDETNFLLSIQADHKVPESGLLFDLHAEGEIFSRGWPPDDWYVAFGWYEPISRRVRGTALRLFNWDFYVILSGRDLAIAGRTFPAIAAAVGCRTGFDKRWKFGPVRVVAAAWFAVDLAASFDPVYVLGQVGMHGELAVKAFGFGFELMLDARLALEAPVNEDDLYFAGGVSIRIGLPWPLPDIEREIPISFGDTAGLPPPVAPLVDAASVTPGYPTTGEVLYRREGAVTSGATLPLDGRVVINFRRPMRSVWVGAPTPVSLARPDQVGETFYRYTLTGVRVRVTPPGGTPHDAAEDVFGQWALSVGDDGGPRAESLILWGTSPFPYAGSLTWPGRTERRSWADLFFRYHTNYPCGDDPVRKRCIFFDEVPFGLYESELRYQPDPAHTAVVFRPFPSGDLLQSMRSQWAEFVQIPIAVVPHTEPHQPRTRCLGFARTTFFGRGGGAEDGPAVRHSFTLWGLAVSLPASRRASGRVVYPVQQYGLRVHALRGDTTVASLVAVSQEFEIQVEEPQSFDRLELLVEPVHAPAFTGREPSPCLVHLCYTSLGLLDLEGEVTEGRLRWGRVLEPLLETEPASPDDPPFGTHLIHEPGTNYRIELDIRTESASDVDGPWNDLETDTEVLTVPVGGAPTDLAPYLQQVTPGDGQRPVYADYDLRVTYNRPYVEAMYHVAGEPLYVVLVDGMGQQVEPTITRSKTEQPALTPENEVFIEQLVDSVCVTADLTQIAGYDETVYATRLATTTPYEARIHGGEHAQPLYRWTFVTSRYRNFAEHIADFRPEPWEEALPEVIDWVALADRLAAAATADRDAEFKLFLAAWQQDLGLRLRTLPSRPEVTLFWVAPQSAPAVRALAIISPEPLLSERTVLRLVRHSEDGTWVEQPFGLLRSRDGTRALLVSIDSAAPTTPIALPAGDYRLELVYRLSGVPGLPDLTRQGIIDDELAIWPFAVETAPIRLVNPED